jgi:molybdenum cofactor guanylyltransferase
MDKAERAQKCKFAKRSRVNYLKSATCLFSGTRKNVARGMSKREEDRFGRSGFLFPDSPPPENPRKSSWSTCKEWTGQTTEPAIRLLNVKRRPNVAAFVLAGGASSRMGRDKGLLAIGGAPLIVRTVRMLEPLVGRVTVVGAPRSYAALGLRTIRDRGAGGEAAKKIRHGPLAGMASALAATHSAWNLIVACDLPYLSAEWVDWLLGRTADSKGQAVVPRTARGLEPLAAVYRRDCRAVIEAALVRGERKVTDVLRELRVETVHPREWRRLDPRAQVLKNMNAPEDYERARRWWEAQKARESSPARAIPRERDLPKAKGAKTWHPSSPR